MSTPAPSPLRALAPLFAVQFFAWSAMFLMWIGAYPLVTLAILHAPPGPAATRLGMVTLACCFAGYATAAALLAFAIPTVTRRVEPGVALGLGLAVGALGLAGMALAGRPILLLPCFAALSVGWSALANLPYTIAGGLVPEGSIDHWFRIFAFSSILPQVAVTFGLVVLVGEIDASVARQVMLAAAASMFAGGLLALLLRARLKAAA